MDLTTLQYVTEEQFVNLAHNIVGKPALIILFVTGIISYWVASAVTTHTKKGWVKARNTFWFFLALFSIMFGLVFFLPQISFKLSEWTISLFTTV